MNADRTGLEKLRRATALLAFATLLAAGCNEADMVDQPKVLPLEPSRFFADGQGARPFEPGIVAVGNRELHPAFETGELSGNLVAHIPLKGFDPSEAALPEADAVAARRAALLRGKERYNIFCSPCHAATGNGNGMIVQRGFSRPPSLHEKRLVEAPPGHYYKVITNGYGAMYSYASRIAPADRWAIVSYIRALQLSQDGAAASVAEENVPAAERRFAASKEGTAR